MNQEYTVDPTRLVSPDVTPADAEEVSLRPKTLEDYIGQEKVKANLSVYLRAAPAPGRADGPCAALRPAGPGQDHAGRHCGPGDGGADPHHLRPRHREARRPGRPADQSARRGDVLFIDEIHRLSRQVEEGALSGAGGLRAGYHDRQGTPAPKASGINLPRVHR